ncbi:small integral membrane protein 24-like [Polypterus senegalus]|uniref:small integral membrane protein 24-like n=1 Tax=Polypterus senegalus TaxID=55291 RepID=UPI0019663457|nr:small integral membrane protein 24-like [Polypterus senegalus]
MIRDSPKGENNDGCPGIQLGVGLENAGTVASGWLLVLSVTNLPWVSHDTAGPSSVPSGSHSVLFPAGRASSTSGSKSLQPWLVGLIAVVGFLFLVFTLMILRRLFCKKETFEEESNINTEGRDNPGLETELDEVDTKNCQNSDF